MVDPSGNATPSSNPPRLEEKNFINEDYQKDPYPLWLWLAMVAIVAAFFWGMQGWINKDVMEHISNSPFLQVTNRQLSLFLWQFPEFMRINAKQKEGYLPGFEYQDKKVNIKQGMSEMYASAPPEVLFMFHTWSRLLRPELSLREFSAAEFKQFLGEFPEWSPENWPEGPSSYKAFIDKMDSLSAEQFASQSKALPIDIQIAVTGWKNFFFEGTEIDAVSPTLSQVKAFLERHPHYARNYWINIVNDERPKYLASLSKTGAKNGTKNGANKVLAQDEMTGFFKAGFYNDTKAEASP